MSREVRYGYGTILALFFVSGACGLVYQVAWSRMMALIFGRSVLAVGIVLAAFMGGLAIGSYLLGRVADRSRNPLRLYAVYEVAIGLSALAASWALIQIAPLYAALHAALGHDPAMLTLARFAIAAGLIIIPTTLMGATLPILSRVVIRNLGHVGGELGRLYAINTLGAVIGTIATGFVLIRLFGLQGAVGLAVAGNLAVGVVAWLLAKAGTTGIPVVEEAPDPGEADSGRPVEPLPRPVAVMLLVVFALSGLTSFAYEIFWTRSLVFVFGNTTYAFTLMLTAFLTGIALGGYAVRRVADRFGASLRLFGWIEVLIGALSAVSLPLLFLIIESESISRFVSRMSTQLGPMILSEAMVAMVLMLLPATLIGATLPLMGRIFVSDLKQTGATVGRVYAVNTLGNVIGALLPGLLILPLLGIQKGILVMALLNVCLGLAVLFVHWRRSLLPAALPAALFVFAAAGIVFTPIGFRFPSESQTAQDAVLFYREGALVTTKVWTGSNSGRKMISVDGINIGGTNDADYKQQILAHLPKLLLRDYRSELSVGLGSGILVGESGRHAALQRIVCAEISSGVVTGAGYFRRENHGILDDPRTEIVVDDISHYLQTTNERFDIISSDGKTAEKYSSNAFSYSREYYDMLRRHLAPGGLAIQWIPAALPSSQYQLVLRTFLDAYPHVTLWYFPPVGRFFLANTFLVGSNEPIVIDPHHIDKVLREDAGAFHGIGKYGLKTAEDVLSHFVAGDATLRQVVSPGPINSFNRPYYEFYNPADYAMPAPERVRRNQELYAKIRGRDLQGYVLDGADAELRERLSAAYRAEGEFLRGYAAQLGNASYREVLAQFDRAVRLFPDSGVLRNQVVAYIMDRFRAYYAQQDFGSALAFLRLATEIHPESPEAREDYGLMLLKLNRPLEASRQLQLAIELQPGLVFARRALGEIALAEGDAATALRHWQMALQQNPDDILTLVAVGVQRAREGAVVDADRYLGKAYRLAPKHPGVINAYAYAQYLAGDLSMARRIVADGGRYYEGNRLYEDTRLTILTRGR